MTEAVLGALSQLKLGDSASPIVYTLISEVLRCGPIGSEAPEVNVTNLDSSSQEYIGGLKNGMTVEFEVNWIPGNTQQELLRDGIDSTKIFQMVWSGSPESTAIFSMVLTAFSRGETTPEGQQTASISGRITGDIAWT